MGSLCLASALPTPGVWGWGRLQPLILTPPAEGAESEDSSGEVDGETETEAWGLADVRELHPGLLAHRAARTRDLPALAAALAHGAEVNWANAEDEGKTPLVQAVLGVSGTGACAQDSTLYPHMGVLQDGDHAGAGARGIHGPARSFSWLSPSCWTPQGSLIVCEFLLQNGADVNQRDSRGRAPLHHATLLGHTG